MQLEIDGIKIFAEKQGEGDAVLLLHGWGAKHESWGLLPQALMQMGKCAVTIDFPGFGQSDEPPEPWSVNEYADFTKKLMKELNIVGCDVIAHSFGGRVTIRIAGEWPEYFRKIVLVDAAGLIPKRGPGYYFRIYRYKLGKRLAKIAWINRLFKLEEKGKKAGSEDYRALTDSMKKTMVRVVNQDLKPYLKNIQSPTLLVWGSEDKSTPLYMAKIMEKEIPDSGLVVFEGAGHYSYLDEYGRFVAVMESFLGGRA